MSFETDYKNFLPIFKDEAGKLKSAKPSAGIYECGYAAIWLFYKYMEAKNPKYNKYDLNSDVKQHLEEIQNVCKYLCYAVYGISSSKTYREQNWIDWYDKNYIKENYTTICLLITSNIYAGFKLYNGADSFIESYKHDLIKSEVWCNQYHLYQEFTKLNVEPRTLLTGIAGSLTVTLKTDLLKFIERNIRLGSHNSFNEKFTTEDITKYINTYWSKTEVNENQCKCAMLFTNGISIKDINDEHWVFNLDIEQPFKREEFYNENN